MGKIFEETLEENLVKVDDADRESRSMRENMKEQGYKPKDRKEKPGRSVREHMEELRNILEEEIVTGESDSQEKKELLKRLRQFCDAETNIMLVGATGCGKSATVNALFNCGQQENLEKESIEVAEVGDGADPQTQYIEKYTIGNLILWDTPGFGDSTENDAAYREMIKDLLTKEDDEGHALIDLVLVVLDGSVKDLGTSYKFLNELIIPQMGEETDRILIALNQADIAMKVGRHWDYDKNEPDETLAQFLEEKVDSIHRRIKEDSGLEVEPVYYCAGYVEEGGDIVRPYNLSRLLYHIVKNLPDHKRIAVMEAVNPDEEQYMYDDGKMDYDSGIEEEIDKAIDGLISDAVDEGAEIGGLIRGLPGALVGAVVGGIVGIVRSLVEYPA